MSLRGAETRHCEPKAKQSIRRRKMMKSYVYILFNKKNGTLYTGVTSNLKKRMYEHKNKIFKGFTEKYCVDKLGYYEILNDIKQAIEREKQIKAGSRMKKIMLIEKKIVNGMTYPNAYNNGLLRYARNDGVCHCELPGKTRHCEPKAKQSTMT